MTQSDTVCLCFSCTAADNEPLKASEFFCSSGSSSRAALRSGYDSSRLPVTDAGHDRIASPNRNQTHACFIHSKQPRVFLFTTHLSLTETNSDAPLRCALLPGRLVSSSLSSGTSHRSPGLLGRWIRAEKPARSWLRRRTVRWLCGLKTSVREATLMDVAPFASGVGDRRSDAFKDYT
ncbi:hypothetical protein XENOCAPTIV_020903 [Xenoophorus captivus]|uniref:Uncharacterized protein n=1 Tax=Xenoophorus captivus TaxID=1517983 RepID=A0ABV0R2P7_9TELE